MQNATDGNTVTMDISASYGLRRVYFERIYSYTAHRNPRQNLGSGVHNVVLYIRNCSRYHAVFHSSVQTVFSTLFPRTITAAAADFPPTFHRYSGPLYLLYRLSTRTATIVCAVRDTSFRVISTTPMSVLARSKDISPIFSPANASKPLAGAYFPAFWPSSYF